jgi:hypothetical protein
MKSKMLIISAVLLAASVAVAGPVQAHDRNDDLWPLYGLTGLILLDAYSRDHRHHRHYYYDGPRYRHEYRRDYSYGQPGRHGPRHGGRDWDRHR